MARENVCPAARLSARCCSEKSKTEPADELPEYAESEDGFEASASASSWVTLSCSTPFSRRIAMPRLSPS